MGYLIRFIARSLIWMLILVGIIVACLRLSFANIGLFKSEIEEWVAAEVIPGLTFGEIRSRWNRISPIFELDQATITLPDRSNPIVIDRLAIEFDFWGSLIFSSPVIREVNGTIDTVVIRKDKEKRWWLNDINLVAGQGSSAADDIEELLASIPHYLHIDLNRLVIEDEISRQKYLINNISANIEHHDDATHLQLLANLPETLGGSMQMLSILEGNVGTVYLQSQQLKLDPIGELLGFAVEKVHRAEAVAEVWINFKDHQIDTVNANLLIDEANFQDNPQDLEIPFSLAMQLSASRENKTWTVSQRLDDFKVNNQQFPPLNTQLRIRADKTPIRIEGWIQDLNIQHLDGIAANYVPNDFEEILTKTEIQGRLENIWFSLDTTGLQSLQVSAQAIDINNQLVDWLPGIDRLNASIVYARQRAELAITSDQLFLDFGDQFRGPLPLGEFQGLVHAEYDSRGTTLSISEFNTKNSDIRVEGRGWLELEANNPTPFLYMRASFEDGIGSQKSKYLPVQLLPKEALDWIDEGIRAADISDGSVMFHGRLEDVEKLHNERSGELYADFAIDNAEVMFDPDWEIATSGRGRLLFHNVGVDIRLDTIDYADVKNGNANIVIPTFMDTVILADINAAAPTSQALPIWLASPVGEDFREIAKNLSDPGGNVKANIQLSLPLERDDLEEEAKVSLSFDNASIKAANWGIQLGQINGKVRVTNESIAANGIKAMYFQDPVAIDIATDNQSQKTLVKVDGLVETAQMLELLPAGLKAGFEGKSHWQVNVAISNVPGNDDAPIVSIESSSDLQGTSVLLPQPYRKSAQDQRRTNTLVNIYEDDQVDFLVKYGIVSKVRGNLEKSALDGLQLADLDLAFGTILKEKQQDGIRLYGSTPNLSIDDWILFYRAEANRQGPGSQKLLPLLQSVDIKVGRITAFNRIIDNTDFILSQSSSGFSGTINSSAIKGKYYFPHHDSVQNPVIIDLDYAEVTGNPEKGQSTGLIPGNMFNMRLRSKEFVYDGRPVTDLELDTSIGDNVMLIESLSFKRDLVKFKFNGSWIYSPATKEHVSKLHASIKGEEFGQAMAKLNFGDTIHNGTINFKGELSWPDEVLRPHWDLLSGQGRIRLKDGILKDVEPGSGRFVGLLSLNALPRRLALDFSDVLFDGMEFDEIKGDLVLEGQALYTSNTKLDGPAAEVKIVGKTGLSDRDYDQKIYVVPNIRYTLPVIGSLAAGSTVGWGLLLLQNLFKSSIDESVEIEYSMTGSWDDPVISVINEPPPVVEEEQRPRNGAEK